MIYLFWFSFFLVFFAYLGYPLALMLWGRVSGYKPSTRQADFTPGLSLLIPVHNEARVIRKKLENTLEIDYPQEALEILFISDGSTDDTGQIIRDFESDNLKLIEIDQRKGKANALNTGLKAARHEIIVFSDASIMLEPNALREISAQFVDPAIGCISGEDHIRELGGEGAYGRYELWLRNQESGFYSIVGASGSFYAQRLVSCREFEEGMAPDFLSVMNAVEAGFRAVTEPRAVGYMDSVKNSGDEFNRKIRTLIRGMSALFYKRHLLNVFKYGRFSIALISHKLIRWMVPFCLVAMLLSNLFLLDQSIYQLTMAAQVMFYSLAQFAHMRKFRLEESMVGKLALYFTLVNISILFAWKRYWSGTRQEIWNPSVRG